MGNNYTKVKFNSSIIKKIICAGYLWVGEVIVCCQGQQDTYPKGILSGQYDHLGVG